MASSLEFVEFAVEQMKDAGTITYRKMFGEFGIYCNEKLFALICDNQLYIKKTEAGKNFSPGLEERSPYKGAKPYFLVEDIDNREQLTKLAVETYKELPAPKPKKSSNKNLE